MNGELPNFNDLKKRFDELVKQIETMHEAWKELHEQPDDEDYIRLYSELIDRETTLVAEAREVLQSKNRLMTRYLTSIHRSSSLRNSS